MGVSLNLEPFGLLKSESCEAFRRRKGTKGRVRRYDIVVWAARSTSRACRTLLGPDTRSAHRDDGTGGGGVPVVRGVGMSAKERVSTSPRDIPYIEDRIVLRWSKTRWRCREGCCGRDSFTESVEQVRRGRAHRPAAFPDRRGDAARSVNEVAAAHGVSWPTAHRAFVAHADELLGEPEPTRVLGIDETRRGKPRWEYRAETARWVRVDPWDTGFVDLTPVHDRTGPARLLDVVAGRSAAALASWLSAQTADFAQRRRSSSRRTGSRLQNRSSPGDVIDPNSAVLNWPEGLDGDVRSCPSSRQSRSRSINRASLDPEVMRELVEHDVSDLAA
jgi:hypothetical protein